MLKWYADNTELSTEKGKPNVLVFGGVLVDENAEKEIQKLLRDVKSKYTYPTLPVKWNFKDLKPTYQEFDRMDDYNSLLKTSYEWREEIFRKSLDINYKVILACTERYTSDKPLSKIKEQLTEICFAQSLMRVGMCTKFQKFEGNVEVILDWPDGSNPKPFNREYFRAYNLGKSSSNVPYISGPLNSLGFNDSLYFAKSTHSAVLQFADLVIGAAKEFILKTIHNFDNSLGYNLTNIILSKYQGFPNKVIEYGMNFAPKKSECYGKIKSEVDKLLLEAK